MAKREYHTEQTETGTPFSSVPSVFVRKKHTHNCVKFEAARQISGDRSRLV